MIIIETGKIISYNPQTGIGEVRVDVEEGEFIAVVTRDGAIDQEPLTHGQPVEFCLVRGGRRIADVAVDVHPITKRERFQRLNFSRNQPRDVQSTVAGKYKLSAEQIEHIRQMKYGANPDHAELDAILNGRDRA